jgi:hypothetical protein
MTLQKVLEQYVQHYVKILFRARKGEVLTHAENLGVAYYRQSAQRVQALIDAPRPAWADLQFTKPTRL